MKKLSLCTLRLGEFLKYWLLIILIILFASCTGGSKTSLSSLTQEEFRKLHELKPVGVRAGLNAKLGLFYIGNGLVERLIILDKDSKGISTIGYINKSSQLDYITAPSDEFQFSIGNLNFSGKNGQLTYLSHEIKSLPGGIKRLRIVLQHRDNEGRMLLKVYVNYEIYPNSAVIRKWLEFENLSDAAIIIENLQVERLNLLGNFQDKLKIYGYNLAEIHALPFSGGADEPIILGFLPELGEGFILGNEAPGVLKHFELYTSENTISIGLPQKGSNWAAEIRIPAGKTSASPKAFILLFKGSDLRSVLRNELGGFVKRYFNILANTKETTKYVYLMNASSDSKAPKEIPGKELKLVCVDYDWQQPIPWPKKATAPENDVSHVEGKTEEKSPAEPSFYMLLELSKSLRESNMKFGIRVNLTAIKAENEISAHSEWAFKRSDGTDWTVLNDEQTKIFCLASDYSAYVAQAMADLIESLDEAAGYRGEFSPFVLDYIILDMPTIGSAEQSIYGCSAFGHGHYSRPESLWKIYESLFEIADFLSQKFPDLVVSISPKTYGTRVPDFAWLSHIDQFMVFSERDGLQISDLTNFLPRNVLLEVWK